MHFVSTIFPSIFDNKKSVKLDRLPLFEGVWRTRNQRNKSSARQCVRICTHFFLISEIAKLLKEKEKALCFICL